MGARDWHIARAKHHKKAADYLSEGGWEDWAAVALFYSAHQWAHSSLADEPGLSKDERHPRKHTSPGGPGNGGRGTTQLVAALYPNIELPYRSLFEASHRTRYDFQQLGSQFYALLTVQHADIVKFCQGLNSTRQKRLTQEP